MVQCSRGDDYLMVPIHVLSVGPAGLPGLHCNTLSFEAVNGEIYFFLKRILFDFQCLSEAVNVLNLEI